MFFKNMIDGKQHMFYKTLLRFFLECIVFDDNFFYLNIISWHTNKYLCIKINMFCELGFLFYPF